jgi:LmbE family N-acetylglucosaminyl deacetylase
MAPTRALIVAAHPDDEVLGCGGSIAKARRQGADVRVLFLAEGVTSRYAMDRVDAPEVRAESKRRNDNAYRALEVLALAPDQVFVSQRPCCRLDEVPQLALVKSVEEHIADFRPERIYTHAADDVNVDHALAHRVVLAAGRPVNRPYLTSIAVFEVLSSTEWNPPRPFAPSLFVDISDTIELKIEALHAYDDEVHPPPHPRSEEVVRALARFRGAQVGVNFAEGFGLIRSLEQ